MSDPSVERRHAEREQQRRIVKALDVLPRLTRTIFLLHRVDDLPYGEIAWRCGISVDEVTKRMADALCGLAESVDTDSVAMVGIAGALDPSRVTDAVMRIKGDCRSVRQ